MSTAAAVPGRPALAAGAAVPGPVGSAGDGGPATVAGAGRPATAAGGGPVVGVLAVQGDVREHLRMLAASAATAVPVRRAEQLATVDALVVPGGESTTISKLCDEFGLREPIRDRIKRGMPVYGSCAGMIMLANRVLDGRPDQRGFGGIEMAVRRNAFGRQVDSFETDTEIAGVGVVSTIFIRAPWVEQVGAGVEVLGSVAGRIVAVRQGRLLATAFHPELTGDIRIHRYFVELVSQTAMSTEG